MLESTQVSKLYSIDMFRHDPNYDDPLNFSQDTFDELFQFVQSRLSRFGDRCEIVRLESAEGAAVVPDGLDFIYLDANHSEEGVYRDLCLWAKKVRDGGLIAGHDYGHPDFAGVKIAVDRFCSRLNWRIHEEGEGVWWTVKQALGISFVIPAFNCSGTIRDTFASISGNNVEGQDEVIVVNDASTDLTPRILDELRSEHSYVRVLAHEVNKGTAAAARNTGIDAASNALIFCVDSDNLLLPASVRPLASHLFATGADAAAFGEIHFFTDRPADVTHKWVFDGSVTLADALAGHYWPGPSGNYLFTKQSWQRAGRYHEPTLENPSVDSWVFGIRQLGTGSKMVTLPGSCYFHRYGHESHYVRNWKRGNQSLAALIGLIPFLDMLLADDVEYLFGPEGRYSWYEKLNRRPLRLRTGDAGRTGRVEQLAMPTTSRKRSITSRLRKIGAWLTGAGR